MTFGAVFFSVFFSLVVWKRDDWGRYSFGVEAFEGEVWRFLTTLVVHGEPLHLFFNLYAMWFLATPIEDVFGQLKTLLLFVGIGVFASLSEYALFGSGIGLSGVAYGLFGLLWVLGKRDPRLRGALSDQTKMTFVVWFFVCIAASFGGYNVANAAHGGGWLIGWLIGEWMTARRVRRKIIPAVTILSVVLVTSCAIPQWPLRKFVNLGKRSTYEFCALADERVHQNRFDDALRYVAMAEGYRRNPEDVKVFLAEVRQYCEFYKSTGKLPSTDDASDESDDAPMSESSPEKK